MTTPNRAIHRTFLKTLRHASKISELTKECDDSLQSLFHCLHTKDRQYRFSSLVTSLDNACKDLSRLRDQYASYLPEHARSDAERLGASLGTGYEQSWEGRDMPTSVPRFHPFAPSGSKPSKIRSVEVPDANVLSHGPAADAHVLPATILHSAPKQSSSATPRSTLDTSPIALTSRNTQRSSHPVDSKRDSNPGTGRQSQPTAQPFDFNDERAGRDFCRRYAEAFRA